jgi:hypothetical protein
MGRSCYNFLFFMFNTAAHQIHERKRLVLESIRLALEKGRTVKGDLR